MKKIFITAILAAVTLTGCSDAYDIYQAGTVTEEEQAFRTADDIKKGINYVYSRFPGEKEIEFDSYFTDELGVGTGNAGQGVNDGSYTFLLLAGNRTVEDIWGRYYGVVNRLNRMENRIKEMQKNIATSDSDFERLQQYLAEIYALRAYSHYKLFAYFTPNYKDLNSLSVIKFNFLQTNDYSRFEKRATVGEIVAFIEKDIQDAKALITAKNSNNSLNTGMGSGYASNEMLDAVLIKMYALLQTSDSYNELEKAFNRISSTKSIADPGSHISMFGSGGEAAEFAEGIFRLKRVSTDNIDDKGAQSGVASAWYSDKVAGGTYMEMGRSLFNELDKLDPTHKGTVLAGNDRLDTRFLVAVHGASKIAPGYASLSPEQYRIQDILFIGKYDGIQNRPLMNSLWVFRYTDMLLALAEKRAFEGKVTGTVALGDFSNVESIIYNIRANRNINMDNVPVTMPTDFSSPKAAYARILEERRVEFAFEGHRYLDMKRLGVLAGSPGFVRDPQDCASTNACNLEPSSLKLTMPIPRSEMVSNPNMVQNPGY